MDTIPELGFFESQLLKEVKVNLQLQCDSHAAKQPTQHQASGDKSKETTMSERAPPATTGSGVTNKPTIDSKRRNYYSPCKSGGENGSGGSANNVAFYPSTKIKLLHQRTSLSLAHSDCGWGYCGETALYVIVDPKEDDEEKKTSDAGAAIGREDGVELGLHLRDGCLVESVEVFAAVQCIVRDNKKNRGMDSNEKAGDFVDAQDVEMEPIDNNRNDFRRSKAKRTPKTNSGKDEDSLNAAANTSTTKNTLIKPLPKHSVLFHHHDPLSIVLTRPAKLHSVEEDGGVTFDGAENRRSVGNSTAIGANKADTLKRSRRYEADAHASRGIRGMTNSLRAASISSALGELRVKLVPSRQVKSDGAAAAAADDDDGSDDDEIISVNHPTSQQEAMHCWKNDLDANIHKDDIASAGESPMGLLEQKMVKDVIKWRCQSRREARLDLIADSLAKASCNVCGAQNEKKIQKWAISAAMKIVIRFSLRPSMAPPSAIPLSVSSASTHSPQQHSIMKNIGGLTFLSPPPDIPPQNLHILPVSHRTPHAYTTSGTHGDHQGVRSWLPTLDSASPFHRSSHELTVIVTARKKDGLWPCASGEDFGCNRSVAHPILGGNEMDILEKLKSECSEEDEVYKDGIRRVERVLSKAEACILRALGERHVRFMNDFFYGDDEQRNRDESNEYPERAHPDGIASSSEVIPDSIPSSALEPTDIDVDLMAQLRQLQPTYVTSIFSSLIWSPCPSRSLGFAIGPFAVLYDPEYFRLDTDEEDNDEDETEDDDNSPLSVAETARKQGEGIRQLYFAPLDARSWIHTDVNDDFIFGPEFPLPKSLLRERPEFSPAALQDHRLIEGSILASTIGVPNRALSLMRDILALPSYRTSSYTQIWIPDAHMSGTSCGGNMIGCPEVGGCNYFLGGAIIDSSLLPPPGMRLPFYNEGKTLQFIQARNAIRGWVRSALPLGSDDDVGQGYLHVLVETFIMSLYERGHGAFGEGGGKGSFFYTKRYAIGSGLNSPNLDFLPLLNIEEDEVVSGGVAIEERGNEHLWRSANNGTETHTSSLDEFVVGQLQAKDFLEALERADKAVPLPSMGWHGSHQSVTFFSNNSASSTALGCGALELAHPMGGQMYRSIKTILLNRVFESRASVSHYTRVIRAAFTSSFLRDSGIHRLTLDDRNENERKDIDASLTIRPPFVICVEEMLKKEGLTHGIFTRALRVMSGPIHEVYLRGSLVDIGRDNLDSRGEKRIVASEGFPNSYVHGASGLYLRVGAHVEAADGGAQATSMTQSAAAVKGIHLHVVVEPVIPQGGSAFGGPVTMRVIENEGQCREFIKTIPENGSRAEWGPIFLHARPVSTAKQQQAASGISDPSSVPANPESSGVGGGASGISGGRHGSSFTSDQVHRGGFQALELIRITNSTPLLWIRVDPHGLYNGRLSIYQQDACLAEQLFHDGDASGQLEAIRTLAERPLKIQCVPKLSNVHDVPISELPVRVLGDCLRGSVALHCDLPHNPLVRSHAALAIAQWQNNKAPETRHVVGGSSWLGLDLLMQYFKERNCHNEVVLPVNFRRLVLHKHIVGGASSDTTSDGGYQYLDAIREKDERRSAIEFADEVEIEEDEEYRVRSACITAIASIRAKDGMTPPSVLDFMEEVLVSGDKAAQGSLLLPSEEEQLKKKQDQALDDELANSRRIIGPNDEDVSNLPYVSLSLVADALLALCYIHVRPQAEFDPATGRPVQVKEDHPILPLMETCRSWLDWDLERTRICSEMRKTNLTGFGGGCQTNIAPCAITALCHLALLKQTTSITQHETKDAHNVLGSKRKSEQIRIDEPTCAQFYVDLFDNHQIQADVTRAAAAQSAVCICCAADRMEASVKEPVGLLMSLEFLLDRILDPSTSPGLRLTLALLMMDACTGKVCSLQRVGSFCGQRSLSCSGSRFMYGPLGPSCGGDNGSALLLTVSDFTYPAANAVNNGARIGLKLLKDNCKDGKYSSQAVVRVASFASRLWRTINGEKCTPSQPSNSDHNPSESVGVCAHDSHLRCTLISLWQWLWPKYCFQLMRAQSWHAMEGTPQYKAMGLNNVLKETVEEREATTKEDEVLKPLALIVDNEIDRQTWRGEMAAKAYEYFKRDNKTSQAEIGQPLPVIEKDASWKLGGWVASTAQQRRAQNLDWGAAVSRINVKLSSKSSGES